MRTKELLVVLLVFFCTNTYGQIYKCQNEYGRALFSNIPCEAQKPPVAKDLPSNEDTATKTVAEPPKKKVSTRSAELTMQAVPENTVQHNAPPKYPFFYQLCLDIKNFFKRHFKGQPAIAKLANDQSKATENVQTDRTAPKPTTMSQCDGQSQC